MPASLTDAESEARRRKVLEAAKVCFLNFGFAKTSFEDIAKRADISRTLLYRIFKDKEDLFREVFVDWLVARHPEARRAAARAGDPYERLIDVCRAMVLEPWADMVAAPMGSEFYAACEKLDPEIDAQHRKVVLQCVAKILGDAPRAEVFLLALDGLLADEPSSTVLERRLRILAESFVGSAKKTRATGAKR